MNDKLIRVLLLLAALGWSAPARAEVLSLELGIDSACPYGLIA